MQKTEEKKRLFSRCDIAGAIAMWGVRQSPYPCPEGLETVINKWFKETNDRFEHIAHDFSCITMTERELYDFIYETLTAIPEFEKWNERKNGREGNSFCSRYDSPPADDSFIDLEALVRNVTHTLRHEAERDEAFDKKHAEENANYREAEDED